METLRNYSIDSSGEQKSSVLSHCVPFGIFILLTAINNQLPGFDYIIYPIKTVLVAVSLFYYWHFFTFGKSSGMVHGILIGLVVLVIWIFVSDLFPLLNETASFDPFSALSTNQAIMWITVRVIGAAEIVPIMEEIFWRGFLVRWIIHNRLFWFPRRTKLFTI